MITAIFILSCLIFVFGYIKYGGFLRRIFEIDNQNPCPSQTLRDNVDFIPTAPFVLFGHHFSSIAGAGPVLGPIIAGLAFGWLPVWLWIILGSILIGGLHDFSSLVISIRNRGRSIAEIANLYMSKRAYRLMLAFIWLSLVYVLTVFTDLTASTFKTDGGVASSSILFIFLALGFGLLLYRLKISLVWATVIFIPLLFLAIWLGQKLPVTSIPAVLGDVSKTWSIFLIVYCFFASVTPVWILLQPRDYLSSFLLYTSVIGGFLGILFGGFSLQYPAWEKFNSLDIGQMFPFLFITVACGAISGFHSLVASGTSSKQLKKETDAQPIGYGAMLLEGLVAVIALTTVMTLDKNCLAAKKPPLLIYGMGMAKFLAVFGLPEKYGNSFGILAVSTFILTTLDTATRLARYVFQEFFNLEGKKTRYLATLATLILPAILALINLKDAKGNIISAWKVIWPVFGATNQLLAGLVLLIVAVWLKKNKKPIWFVIIPMVFMLAITMWALTLILLQYKLGILGVIAGLLLILALFLLFEAVKTLAKTPTSPLLF